MITTFTGNTGASMDCFLLALAEAPVAFTDLVTTNFAALLYRCDPVT